MDAPLSCVVADDEPTIRARVARFATANGLVVAEEVANGHGALAAVARHRPEILFLDIRMPGMSGLDVLAQLGRLPDPPATVLVTAWGEHALAAFELAAIDYVLKPLDPARFAIAVERASAIARDRQSRGALERLGAILRHGRPDRRTLRDGARFLQLAPSDIDRFVAMDDYVEVHSRHGRHLVNCRMAHLEDLLPSPPFLRVHRSHIVNLDRVVSADLSTGRPSRIALSDQTSIPVARSRVATVRTCLLERGLA
jgi:two-component system, LytTR family, response regulator